MYLKYENISRWILFNIVSSQTNIQCISSMKTAFTKVKAKLFDTKMSFWWKQIKSKLKLRLYRIPKIAYYWDDPIPIGKRGSSSSPKLKKNVVI